MWWMVAAFVLAGLLGLELRRFWREQRDTASGTHRYALYAAGHGERALRLIEIDADGRTRQIGGSGSAAAPYGPRLHLIHNTDRPEPSVGLRTSPDGGIVLPFRTGAGRIPPQRRRNRR